MKGDLVFEILGSVDAAFILEAAPDNTSAPIGVPSDEPLAKSPKDRRPLSGWVTAAVCAIVAMGVYLGAMWLGQGQWQPPASTGEGTAKTDVTAPDETADETVAETTPPDDGLADPLPTFANKHYVVEEIDGQLYLNFFESKGTYGGMIEPSVKFDDAEDMFLSLYYGDLDEEQMKWLSSFRKTVNGYKTIDLTRLATPVLEEGGSVQEALYYSDYYAYYYYIPSISQNVYMTVHDNDRKEGWAAKMVADREKDAAHRTETTIDGMSAVVVTKSDERNVYVSFVDEATGTEIYAKLEFMLDPVHSSFENYVSDTVPWRVNIIGCHGKWEYRVNVNVTLSPTAYKDTFEITKDFLLSFKIEPFDTPSVEPAAIIEKQDHEITKEDGAWYLTFPEWDGTFPLPIEGLSIAMPSFENARAMREILMGGELSLYNQLAFKLNADENGRVRIPDLDQLLVHSFPKSNVMKPSLWIYGSGYYEGRISYSDCLGGHYASFGVMSEYSWQKKLKARTIPVEDGSTLLSTTEVDGTYDGLPCTFYVCTAQNEYEEYTYVFCHIPPSEATGGQEYFFTHYEFLEFYLEESNHIRTEDIESLYAIDISVFGSRNGQYYLFTLSELKDATADTLKDFSVSPLLP